MPQGGIDKINWMAHQSLGDQSLTFSDWDNNEIMDYDDNGDDESYHPPDDESDDDNDTNSTDDDNDDDDNPSPHALEPAPPLLEMPRAEGPPIALLLPDPKIAGVVAPNDDPAPPPSKDLSQRL